MRAVQCGHVRARIATLALLCGLTFFLGLGRSAITDSDEAFYAESAREMLESADWLTPRFNYEVRFEKPVLYYWAVASTYAVAGVSAAAARWPSALSGLGLVLLTYACGRRWLGDRVGWLAGSMVATSFGYFAIARSALPDLPLTLFVCITIAAGAIGLGPESDTRASGNGDPQPVDRHRQMPRTGWLVLSAAAAGLAVLTKGPVGIVLPALVLGAWCVVSRAKTWTWRGLWRPTGLQTAVAVGAFLAVSVPWYAAMAFEHGGAYLYRFFVGENLERFATARYNEPRSPFFYVPIVLAGFFPWSFFLAGWLADWWRARQATAVQRLLWLWWLLPLVFYSVSVGKQPRYILPILPPLALLVASAIQRRVEEDPPGSRLWMALPTAAVGVTLTVLGFALHHLALVLMTVTDVGGFSGLTTLGAGLLIALGFMLAVVAWTLPVRVLPTLVMIAAALTQVTLAFTVMASSTHEPVRQMASLVVGARHVNEPVATHRVFVRNLVYYTGIQTLDLFDPAQAREFMRQPRRVLLVLPEPVAEQLEQEGFELHRHGSVRYFNSAGMRAGTLLAPDESRDVQTVVLVSNR